MEASSKEKLRTIESSFGPCGKSKILSSFQSTCITSSCREIERFIKENAKQRSVSKARLALEDGHGMYQIMMRTFREEYELLVKGMSEKEELRHRIIVLQGLQHHAAHSLVKFEEVFAEHAHCVTDENDTLLKQVIFSFLSTHLSRPIVSLFTGLLEQQILFWSKCEVRTRTILKYLLCGMSGSMVSSSRVVDGVFIPHCQFAKHSPQEMASSNILFLNQLDRCTDLNGVDVVCITENFTDTIPGKMIVKIDDDDMDFMLDLFSLCIGQTGQISYAQQISNGSSLNLFLVPESRKFQTLLIRAPTPQVTRQYFELLSSILRQVLDIGGVKSVKVVSGGGTPEVLLSKYFERASSSFTENTSIRSKGHHVTAKIFSACYDNVIKRNIYNITDKTNQLDILTKMKRELQGIISIQHSFMGESSEQTIVDKLWVLDSGLKWGVIDILSQKHSLFEEVCIDLIAEFKVDKEALPKKTTKNLLLS